MRNTCTVQKKKLQADGWTDQRTDTPIPIYGTPKLSLGVGYNDIGKCTSTAKYPIIRISFHIGFPNSPSEVITFEISYLRSHQGISRCV